MEKGAAAERTTAGWNEAEIGEFCRGISAILECPDIGTAAQQILATCNGLIRAGTATVVMLPEGEAGVISALDRDEIPRVVSPPRGAAARRLRESINRVGPGFYENTRPRLDGLPLRSRGRSGVKNLLAVPITLGGATVGVICLGDKPGGFGEHDLEVASAFGSLAGVTHQRCTVTDTLARDEERFRSIFAQSPIGIEVYDAAGKLLDANQACLDMFGVASIVEVQGFNLFQDPNLSPDAIEKLRLHKSVRAEIVFDFGRVQRQRLFRTRNRGRITIDALITPLVLHSAKAPFGYLVQVQDVTALRRSTAQLQQAKETLEQRVALATRSLTRTNEALRKQVQSSREVKKLLADEHRFRTAVEESLTTGIMVADRQERLIHVNRAFCRMVGWSREELVGRVAPFPFWPPEDHEKRLETFRRLRTGRLPSGVIRARYLRRSGERFDVFISNSRLRDPRGRVFGLVASVSDFTHQLETEEALLATTTQLKTLTNQLLSVEERERKRISRELHDSLGQTLSALKYRLEEASNACGRDGCAHAVKRKLGTAGEVLGNAIDEVRSIVSDLRPSILDDLGLLSAIGWFCREFGRMHPGFRITTRIGVAEPDLPEELKIIIFRLLQESLRNAVEHGGAGRATVRLVKTGTLLEFTVKDDGKGFAAKSLPRGAGILGMNERAELSGGTFAVTSRPGRGTLVRAAWRLAARR